MSGMVEFRITSDLQEIRKQAITTNYADVKAWVDGVAEQYRSIVVTEDGAQAAKQDRANLRKLQANIDQVRKECRAAALAVSAETEGNCKELVATLETAVQNLDTQAKAFEARRKEEKAARLKTYFDRENELHNTNTYLTWEGVLDPKWLNATASEDAAEKAIDAIITDTVNGIAAIVSLQSPFEVELLEHYRETHDVAAVLQKNARLLEMKKAQEEREKAAREAEAAAKYAAAQRQKMTPLKPECIGESDEYEVIDIVGTVEPQRAQPVNDLMDEDGHEMSAAQEPEYTVDFRAHGTAVQLNGLRSYMKNNGIRFERVPE